MNCGLVKALLTAYLDNELALEERQSAAFHLQSCAACSTLLADFRRFDTLLSRLPRAEPQPSLRDRIFSSIEYKKLAGTSSNSSATSSRALFDDSRYSKFISLSARSLRMTSEVHRVFVIPLPYRRSSGVLRVMQIAIVTCFLLTLSVSGFIGYRLWQKQVQPTHTTPAMLQPTATLQHPLLVGPGCPDIPKTGLLDHYNRERRYYWPYNGTFPIAQVSSGFYQC